MQATQVISWISLFVSLLWPRSLLKPNCSSDKMLFKWQSCTNSLYTTFSDISDNPFMQEMTYNWTCLISFCKQPLKLMHWWCTDYRAVNSGLPNTCTNITKVSYKRWDSNQASSHLNFYHLSTIQLQNMIINIQMQHT